MVWVLLGLGCGGGGALTASPASLAWGEVDFMQDMPDGGYDPQDVAVQNTGDGDVTVTIAGFDDDHLAYEAQTDDGAIPLAAGASAIVSVSVVAYDVAGGELGDEVTGSFSFEAEGVDEPATVTWSFTPIRNFGDSGS